MESLQENHEKPMFECFYYFPPILNSFSETKYLILVSVKGVKTIEKPSSGQPKGGCTCLMEVAGLQRFDLQHFTEINFRTLITGHSIKSNCLMNSGHLTGCRLLQAWLYMTLHLYSLFCFLRFTVEQVTRQNWSISCCIQIMSRKSDKGFQLI